jgi:hypothetical protein
VRSKRGTGVRDGVRSKGGGAVRRRPPACEVLKVPGCYGPSNPAKNDRGDRSGAHRGMLRVGDVVRRGRRRGSTVEAGGARGDVARRCLGASGPDGRTRQASVMLVDGSARPEWHRRRRNRRRSSCVVKQGRRLCAARREAESGERGEGGARAACCLRRERETRAERDSTRGRRRSRRGCRAEVARGGRKAGRGRR